MTPYYTSKSVIRVAIAVPNLNKWLAKLLLPLLQKLQMQLVHSQNTMK